MNGFYVLGYTYLNSTKYSGINVYDTSKAHFSLRLPIIIKTELFWAGGLAQALKGQLWIAVVKNTVLNTFGQTTQIISVRLT